MASQLMLFETDAVKQPDGSFLIRPVRVWADREIGVAEAMKLLGYRDRKMIYPLLDSGKIQGWKPESERGNGKWRIAWQSVADYKAARLAAARRGDA